MATKFETYMATNPNARRVIAKLNVFKDSGSTDIYVEERDPAAVGTTITIGDPLGQKIAADSVSTVLSSRHEDVTTPLAFRISDSTEFLTANETYALNTQFVKAAQTLRLPVSAFLNGWDYTNNTRKELRTNTDGDLRVEQANVPTSMLQGNALVPVAYDNIAMNYAGATADVYTYKVGVGTVATVTVNYVDATKAVISSVVRT
jgi:hypothetical protein